mgnify:CR=1 FL=1
MKDKLAMPDLNEKIEILYEEIRKVYLEDSYPWVVGFSGGKDSTATLQLIWYAIRSLPKEKRQKKIYVLSSDTLVETPIVVDHIVNSLDLIDRSAKEEGLPFSSHKVEPAADDTFWINLIGKGYPAPNQRFRWCTDRLKIQPANQFILDQTRTGNQVIMVLGARKDESASRSQVISKSKIRSEKQSGVKESLIRPHTSLTNAYVYTPIEEFSTKDVWEYLLGWPSPWGNANRDLAAMYKNAQDGECPLVIDKSTPSCGNSRFGCWSCTVVTADRSMEAMVDNGEEWLMPLLDFRDFLASTQDPKEKYKIREYKRRNGRIAFKNNGEENSSHVPGPYKINFRKEILRRLLSAEKKAKANSPVKDFSLISRDELQKIRHIWQIEEHDWEDSIQNIYKEVYDKNLNWLADDVSCLNASDKELLGEICETHHIPTGLVAKLLDLERQMSGMSRRSDVFKKIDNLFEEDWRTDAEVKQLEIKGIESLDNSKKSK